MTNLADFHAALAGAADIGLVLGSGLSSVAEAVEDRVAIPFSEIATFPPAPGVSGHGRELVMGRMSGKRVAILTGRLHAYESGDAGVMRQPIALLAALGCKALLLTNAAGSLREEMPAGSLMAISDHINWGGLSPLTGDHSDARFVDMTDATFSTFLSTRLDPDQAAPDFGGTPSTAAGTGRETDRRQAPRTLLHLLEPERRILSCSVRLEEGGSKVLYFRDITREAEVDRMKSEFLSTAAHELRTPMASVFGFSELLLKRDYDDKTRKDLLSTIHRQAGALIHLLNELLDLARIEARAGKDFKIKVQPLKPIVENTVAALLVPNDPRKVVVDLPETLPHCAVDAEKLQQALTNLLSNAYKYSPNGGEIRLDVITVGHADQVGIRVTDHGIGMTPEQLARCFERFYRADASQNIPGTGLGLALVKEIIEIFGGSVQVESAAGRGTTATVWLKVSEREAVAA